MTDKAYTPRIGQPGKDVRRCRECKELLAECACSDWCAVCKERLSECECGDLLPVDKVFR